MRESRTVHARYPGMAIVRHGGASRWFLEPTDTSLPRQQVLVREAADAACWDRENGEVFFGLPGGQRFDYLVRKRLGH